MRDKVSIGVRGLGKEALNVAKLSCILGEGKNSSPPSSK